MTLCTLIGTVVTKDETREELRRILPTRRRRPAPKRSA